MSLAGKTALVSGGSRGIGAAIARQLAQDGAVVMIGAHRSRAAAEAVQSDIVAAGGSAEVAVCDVRQEDAVEQLVRSTIDRFGGIDILCANSGVIGPMEPIHDVQTADFDDCVATNLRGMFLINRAVLRHMIARKSGRIINTASIFGKRGWANYGVYCATKAGVIAMTQSIALENATNGITANCICPGATDSDMMTFEIEHWSKRYGLTAEAMNEEFLKLVPMGRYQQPAEQAHMAAFLATERAGYITGVAISCAGGMELM